MATYDVKPKYLHLGEITMDPPPTAKGPTFYSVERYDPMAHVIGDYTDPETAYCVAQALQAMENQPPSVHLMTKAEIDFLKLLQAHCLTGDMTTPGEDDTFATVIEKLEYPRPAETDYIYSAKTQTIITGHTMQMTWAPTMSDADFRDVTLTFRPDPNGYEKAHERNARLTETDRKHSDEFRTYIFMRDDADNTIDYYFGTTETTLETIAVENDLSADNMSIVGVIVGHPDIEDWNP